MITNPSQRISGISTAPGKSKQPRPWKNEAVCFEMLFYRVGSFMVFSASPAFHSYSFECNPLQFRKNQFRPSQHHKEYS